MRQDYARLRRFGIKTIREGLRWHLIEQQQGRYDFSSLVPIIEASLEAGLQVIWDLFHFGWPAHLDIFDRAWIESFAAFAYEFTALWNKLAGRQTLYVSPINEISFLSWAGGDAGFFNPFAQGRGLELKIQLVRASIEAAHAIRGEHPGAIIVAPDPVIHVAGDLTRPGDTASAETSRLAMFEAWDMLSGLRYSGLGGGPTAFDVIGINYYDRNQRRIDGTILHRGDPDYRPFHRILKEVWNRYRMPLLITETGAEYDARAPWFAYIAEEAKLAINEGIPLQGICLYPILNHLGWDDDRICSNGMWGFSTTDGFRELFQPLAAEIYKQDFIPTEEKDMMFNTRPAPPHTETADLICFSHLRWGFVFQRPQHLMSRFARTRRVFFVEEPVYADIGEPVFHADVCSQTQVIVVTPKLPLSFHGTDVNPALQSLLAHFMASQSVEHYVAWFYTPMALEFADWLSPDLTIYDCMDELSLFQGAPARLCEAENELLQRADLVFTGGVSLFEAKRHRHPRVFPFPSGVDVHHFFQARSIQSAMEDQKQIPEPRLGYAGVIDERLDLNLIDELAARRPEWQIVMLGPVVKIDPASLPRRQNLHWMGMKQYRDLPRYFSGWKVGLLPFAMNDSTRFISPTKTPEYLAAGLPVVSTPIRDVVTPYGDAGMVRIAKNADEFIEECERAMAGGYAEAWRIDVDRYLSTLSWDDTWESMNRLIRDTVSEKQTTEADGRFPTPVTLTTPEALLV